MTYKAGDVVEVDTAYIIEGKGHEHMVIIRDDRVPADEWWAFFFTVTDQDLERLRRREKIKVKIKLADDDFTAFVEAPQSPPYLRYEIGRVCSMGFESQEWGRYPWLA